jgi:hypothetical protein
VKGRGKPSSFDLVKAKSGQYILFSFSFKKINFMGMSSWVDCPPPMWPGTQVMLSFVKLFYHHFHTLSHSKWGWPQKGRGGGGGGSQVGIPCHIMKVNRTFYQSGFPKYLFRIGYDE